MGFQIFQTSEHGFNGTRQKGNIKQFYVRTTLNAMSVSVVGVMV